MVLQSWSGWGRRIKFHANLDNTVRLSGVKKILWIQHSGSLGAQTSQSHPVNKKGSSTISAIEWNSFFPCFSPQRIEITTTNEIKNEVPLISRKTSHWKFLQNFSATFTGLLSESPLLGNPLLIMKDYITGSHISTAGFCKGWAAFQDCKHHARYSHFEVSNIWAGENAEWLRAHTVLSKNHRCSS